KNLPAKIVEKVRVVERKSDQAEFTGIDDGEEETVIDLGIKKGMMNGWFGNLMGGYGTEERYQAAGMLGRFTKTSQVSVIGNANNTNNRGFMDMAGSMMAGMRGGRGMGGGRGMFTGNGITESWMGGVNAATEVLDGKMELTGSYMYSGSDKNVQEKKVKETMLSDNNILYNYENGYELTRSDGHRISGEVEYNISKKTSLVFRPSFNFTSGDFESFNDFITLNNADSTNRGMSKDWGDNNAQQANGMLLLRQRLGKPGRTMSLRVDYGFSNNEMDGGNYSSTNYYDNNIVDSVAVVDQRYFQRDKSYNLGGRFSYTEPLGKNFFVEAAYRYSYKDTDSDKNTYNKGVSGSYDVLDTLYSSNYENVFITQQAELNFMKQEEKYNLTVGMSVQPTTTKSYGRGRDTSYSVTNFAPSARFDYRISDQKFLRVRYRGRTSQPSISQLLPIPDNTNPLRVTIGNMNLNPEFTHSLNLEYRTGNREKYSWFGTFIDASYTTDKIVSRSWYDDNGVQYTQPYNDGTGVYAISGRAMYNSKIAKSNFSIMSMSYVRFGNGVTYVSDKGDFVKNITETLSLSEHLTFAYRNDFMELRAGGRVNYQNAWYSVQSIDKVATWSNEITGYANVNIPGGINITTDVAYKFYIGYGDGYGDNATIWNAEISKQLFKNQITLKAKIYDILKDAKNVYRTTTENYIQDTENNTLGQYIMVSLVWRFGKFTGGGPGMGGRGGMMRGGPMGPRR
ncbi:MAG: outer membrane beta-barrel protein, partial [Bacteroidales bacterium]|nr:outer membrane beta-barrel protein [Bacteroidales bacterium]